MYSLFDLYQLDGSEKKFRWSTYRSHYQNRRLRRSEQLKPVVKREIEHDRVSVPSSATIVSATTFLVKNESQLVFSDLESQRFPADGERSTARNRSLCRISNARNNHCTDWREQRLIAKHYWFYWVKKNKNSKMFEITYRLPPSDRVCGY